MKIKALGDFVNGMTNRIRARSLVASIK